MSLLYTFINGKCISNELTIIIYIYSLYILSIIIFFILQIIFRFLLKINYNRLIIVKTLAIKTK